MQTPSKHDKVKARRQHSRPKSEEVIAVTHQFPIVLRVQLIIGMLIILAALLPWAIAVSYQYSWGTIANWWLVFSTVVLIWYWLRTWVSWYYTVYILSTEQITDVRQRGFFNRKVSNLPLANIQSVNLEIRGIQAAIFGFGTIIVETLSGSGQLELKYIHRPQQFLTKINQELERFNSTSNNE